MHEILNFGKFESADFKYDNDFFQIYYPKYIKNVFFNHSCKVCLQFDETEEADLKYDNCYLEIQVLLMPTIGPKFKVFLFFVKTRLIMNLY